MNGISTERAPSANVVVPHFLTGAIVFLILSILILSSTDIFFGHFYHPKLLAITHLTALGWVTMIIFGALYQLIPVVFETSLYSEKIARINLPIFLLGILGMAYAFWSSSFTSWLPWASALTALALILFAINVLLSVRTAAKKNYSARFIVSAVVWLLFTAILGLLMALNHRYSILDEGNFTYLKIHAHFGIVGWFLQLIMGVGSVLLPMFLVSHDLDERKLKAAYLFVNIGLLGLTIDWFFKTAGSPRPLFAGLIILGVLAFITYIIDAYKNKLRKLDIGMKLTSVALIAIIVPIVLGFLISLKYYLGAGIPLGLTTLYGFTVFFAFITPLILGQTYKTLPFIIWLHHYQHLVGKKKIPMPANLYSNNIAEMHIWTYIAAILFLSVGILTSSIIVTKIGGIFLLSTAILYLGNVLLIILHKAKIAPLEKPEKKADDDLMDLLRTVIDPEVEINIVDMGLIYKLDYDKDKKVDIEMTLSTPNCPIADSIVMNVMETILAKHPDFDVNVHLTFEPKWTPELITESGKEQLKAGHKWK